MQAILSTFLECTVCSNTYDEVTYRPMLIPCSHSLCSRCLATLEPSNQSIMCPFCRKSVNRNLAIFNRVVVDILEHFRSQSNRQSNSQSSNQSSSQPINQRASQPTSQSQPNRQSNGQPNSQSNSQPPEQPVSEEEKFTQLLLLVEHRMNANLSVPTTDLQAVVTGLKRFATQPIFAERAGGLLLRFSQNQANDDHLVKAGGIDAIAASMHKHVQNVTIQSNGCAALCNLARGSNDDSLAPFAGFLFVALEQHRTHPQIQENTFLALLRLVGHPTVRSMLSNEANMQSLVNNMKRHQNTGAVQQHACALLAQLGLTKANEIKIMRTGGAKAIVNAMKQHRHNRAIQYSGCQALFNLSLDSSNEGHVVGVGGIESITIAMGRHADDLHIQKLACGALEQLSVDESNDTRIVNQGGIYLIRNAMERYRNDGALLVSACDAIYRLSQNQSVVNDIVRAGAIDALVSAMGQHLNNLKLQRSACLALCSLCEYEYSDVRDAVLSAGGYHVLNDSRDRHSNNQSFYDLASNVLRYL